MFDIYASVEQDKAWLMDINPYSPNTDSLLFTWHEILALKTSAAATLKTTPELRLVSKASVMSHGPQYSAHQVPFDLIDTSDGVDPATFAHDLHQKMARAAFDGTD